MEFGKTAHRPATIEDVKDFSRLADAMENIDEISFPIFPREVPYEIQDLTIYRHVWANTSKDGGGGLSRNGFVWMNTSPAGIRLLLRMAEVKYRAWHDWQRAKCKNAITIHYDWLVHHPLFVPKEQRKDWHLRKLSNEETPMNKTDDKGNQVAT